MDEEESFLGYELHRGDEAYDHLQQRVSSGHMSSEDLRSDDRSGYYDEKSAESSGKQGEEHA